MRTDLRPSPHRHHLARPSPLSLSSLLLALALAACGGGSADETAAEERTRAQKDSAVAESGLPGSRAVGKAMDAASAAAERAERHDSIG